MGFVEVMQEIIPIMVMIGQATIIFLLVSFFLKTKLSKNISKRTILLVFIVSLVATLGSLFYSEIAGYEPCKLCWYQRIFMYPIVLIGAAGILAKAKDTIKYVLFLAIPGFILAVYHYFYQMSSLNAACTGAVDCGFIQFASYGYITIPLMAATAFLMIILLATHSKK